ncbi:MAG: calcium/sodium antiporter [Clostridia bacterium]|nr:calcium/sodium antiporter [Clostridia bacterium]
MNVFFAILLMVAGLFLLIKGSDLFVDLGTKIGKKFKMSEVLIGLTIVSIGTSLPELLLSLSASFNGNSDFLIGNIIGTNIFNMCCILGIICLTNPLKLLRETIRKDMNMSLISSTALFVLLMDIVDSGSSHNAVTRTDGIILLLFFSIFIYYTLYEFGEYLRNRREKKYKDDKEKQIRYKKDAKGEDNKKVFSIKDIRIILKDVFLMLLCIIAIYIGAELVVSNAVVIARVFKVSETFISIAIIAVGTSLPEISTSIAAIKKNRINIAIGNLIGSNMLNTLFVIGTSALINPIKVNTPSLVIDAAVFVLVCLVLRLFTRKKPEITAMEGFTLLSIYACYMVFVLYRH